MKRAAQLGVTFLQQIARNLSPSMARVLSPCFAPPQVGRVTCLTFCPITTKYCRDRPGSLASTTWSGAAKADGLWGLHQGFKSA